jgi:hypothetical protein
VIAMPQGKGRKKGRNRERRERSSESSGTTGEAGEDVSGDATGAGPEARTVQQANVQAAQPMPSSMARATGVMLAAVTGIVGAYVLWNGLSDSSASAGAARIVVGFLVLLLAAVVGVLSLAPELVVSVARRMRS